MGGQVRARRVKGFPTARGQGRLCALTARSRAATQAFSGFGMRENIKELGDDLDFAFGHVSENNPLEVHIQWLKTDEGVLPAILGGPIRSTLAGEG